MNFRYYKTEKLIGFTLVLAVLCSWLSGKIEECLIHHEVISQAARWVDAFSTLTLIGLVFWYINSHGWKISYFKWLIDIPDLNGRYKGTLISSYRDENNIPEEMECVIEIKQSASYIHIFGYFGSKTSNSNSSISHSVSEQLVRGNDGLFLIYYIFTNESDALKVQLSNHLGTGFLKFHPDNKTLGGNYYNQRGNTGNIKVEFAQTALLEG